MLQRGLGIVLVLLFAGAAACAKFSGEESPVQDASVDRSAGSCAGSIAFTSAGLDPVRWASATTIKSARLGRDRVWYVAVKDDKGSTHIETRTDEPPGPLMVLLGLGVKDADDEQATLTGDQTFLAFQSNRTADKDAIWIAKRTAAAQFEQPVPLVIPGVMGEIQDPYFVESALYVAANIAVGNRAIFQAAFAGTPVTGPATQVTNIGGESDHPTVTADQLEMFFVNKSSPTLTGTMMYARRAKPSDAFTDAKPVLATGTNEHPTWISPDGCDLFVIDADDRLQKLSRRP